MNVVEQLAQRHWTDLVLIGASIVWVALAAWATLRRRPGDGVRVGDLIAVGSTIVLAAAWVLSFRHVTPGVEAKVTPAAAAVSTATCASISNGMTAAEVRAKLGEPDEVTSAEDLRGPGAERWSYAALQCRVHLVDSRVTFID